MVKEKRKKVQKSVEEKERQQAGRRSERERRKGKAVMSRAPDLATTG